MNLLGFALCLGSLFGGLAPLAAKGRPSFVVIPLGTCGGLYEDDLSSYLLAPQGSPDFVALDAGTVMTGLRRAAALGTLAPFLTRKDAGLTPAGAMLQRHLKAYLISHAHLDHLAGMMLNAPVDTPKEILGSAQTIDVLREHLFNWKAWPDFGIDSKQPLLRRHRLTQLEPGQEVPVPGTRMTVEPWLLSHFDGYVSTAFLVGADGAFVLYCGDTGADTVEHSDRLRQLWSRIAPLVRAKTLKGIFLETSYADGLPDENLFGHLTPALVMEEFAVLAQAVDPLHPATALAGLTLIVTHVKPSVLAGVNARATVMKQLRARNRFGLRIVAPRQGYKLTL